MKNNNSNYQRFTNNIHKKLMLIFILLLVIFVPQVYLVKADITFKLWIANTFQPTSPRFFLVSLPDLGNQRYADNSIGIPRTDLGQIQVFIPKPLADQVDYGKIFVSLNGQSANRITDKVGLPDGKLLTLNLKRLPGFLLRNGNNSIEVSVQPNSGSALYGSCVLTSSYNQKTSYTKGVETFTGKKYAIVIGISNYHYVKKLNFAHADARLFRDFLLSPEGGQFPNENISFLENEDATLSKIKETIEIYIKKLRAEDLLIFFMAGHGAPENGDSTNPRPPFYYVTVDTKLNNMANTALPMELLRNKLTKESRSNRVISFIDTCHSGGFGQDSEEGDLAMRSLSNDLTNQYFESSLYSEEGLSVITSSDINEISYEDPVNSKEQRWEGHGVFTFYLLKGLKGHADFDGDKIVTTGEVFSYLQEHVSKSVEEYLDQKIKDPVKRGKYKGQHPRAAISNNDKIQLSLVLKTSLSEKRTIIERTTSKSQVSK